MKTFRIFNTVHIETVCFICNNHLIFVVTNAVLQQNCWDSCVLISFSTKNIYAFYCILIHNGIITIESFAKTCEIITKLNGSNKGLWINRQILEIFG